jgi:hypothetical protein
MKSSQAISHINIKFQPMTAHCICTHNWLSEPHVFVQREANRNSGQSQAVSHPSHHTVCAALPRHPGLLAITDPHWLPDSTHCSYWLVHGQGHGALTASCGYRYNRQLCHHMMIGRDSLWNVWMKLHIYMADHPRRLHREGSDGLQWILEFEFRICVATHGPILFTIINNAKQAPHASSIYLLTSIQKLNITAEKHVVSFW